MHVSTTYSLLILWVLGSRAALAHCPPNGDATPTLIAEAAAAEHKLAAQFKLTGKITQLVAERSANADLRLEERGNPGTLLRYLKGADVMQQYVAARALIAQQRHVVAAGDALVRLYTKRKAVLTPSLRSSILLLMDLASANKITARGALKRAPYSFYQSKSRVANWWKRRRKELSKTKCATNRK